MNVRLMLMGLACFILVGCGIEQAIRKNDDRYAQPGALDLPLTGFYSHYEYKLLYKYRITHQWIRESSCGYRTIESRKYDGKDRFFNVRDIFEEGESTWQRFDAKTGNYNFDRYVRPEYAAQLQSGKIRTEKGYEPLCFESWWNTSNYIRLRLQKRPLNELIKAFNERYPEGIWTTKTVNNLTWHVQETPQSQLRTRPLNGVGGPYQSWVLPLADTGYTMAIELGASKESLQYPETQVRMQAMLKHLIESVSIEPINTNTKQSL